MVNCFQKPKNKKYKQQLNESYGYKPTDNENEAGITLMQNGSPPLDVTGSETTQLVVNGKHAHKHNEKLSVDCINCNATLPPATKVSCVDKVTQTDEIINSTEPQETKTFEGTSIQIGNNKDPIEPTKSSPALVDTQAAAATKTGLVNGATTTEGRTEEKKAADKIPCKGWAAVKRASFGSINTTDPTAIIQEDGTISFDVCRRLLDRPSVKNYTTLNICLKKCSTKFYGDILYNCDALQTMFNTLAALSTKRSRSLSDTVLQSEVVKAIKILINSEIGMSYLLDAECSLVTDMAFGKVPCIFRSIKCHVCHNFSKLKLIFLYGYSSLRSSILM